jgi:hypothetical protein
MALRKLRMATRATRSDRLLGMVCGKCKARLRKARPRFSTLPVRMGMAGRIRQRKLIEFPSLDNEVCLRVNSHAFRPKSEQF